MSLGIFVPQFMIWTLFHQQNIIRTTHLLGLELRKVEGNDYNLRSSLDVSE